MKFRKKPVVIEAYHWSVNAHDWPQWLADAYRKNPDNPGAFFARGSLLFGIRTLEGVHDVIEDDWIIQGVAGELYPCKPAIFEQTYEIVVEAGQ